MDMVKYSLEVVKVVESANLSVLENVSSDLIPGEDDGKRAFFKIFSFMMIWVFVNTFDEI